MAAINALGLTRGQNSTDDINEKLPTSGTPTCAVKATGTLTLATKPTADDTITIGTTIYTFNVTGTGPGAVAIGAAIADSKLALVAAINGTDANATPHPQVVATAFSGDDMVITAKLSGTAGNAIATTTDLNDGTDDFAAEAMSGGVVGTPGEIGDCFIDSAYLYYCVAEQTDGANWRRISLGSAY